MASDEVIRLEIPNSPRFVGVARKALEAITANLALTDRQLDELKLAVGEACTNAVKYGSPSEPAVHIEYRVSPDCLLIRIRNKGAEFRPGSEPRTKPEVAHLPVGGLGLYVIEQCVDDLRISSERGETVLTMTKKIGSSS